MTAQTFAYEHEGQPLTGYLAMPQGAGPHPGVLVIHSALGPDALVRRRADDLAAGGYIALATDMYGAGEEGTFDHIPPFMALQNDPPKLRSRVLASYDALRALPQVDDGRIGAIGYCFGGQCALELARSGADTRGVVSFHGLLTTANPAQPGTVRARMLVLTGELDPYAPASDVAGFQEEMNTAGADWHVTVYGGGYHAFTEPDIAKKGDIPGVRYDPFLDRLSWAQAAAFLDATLQA